MSTVHDRWELVEPLLIARPLLDEAGFATSQTEFSEDALLQDIRKRHLVEEHAVARALAARDRASRTPIWRNAKEKRSICDILTDAAGRWLLCDGTHWSLCVDPGKPAYEILRWRFASLLLPASTFVAAALAREQKVTPTRLQILPHNLAPRGPVTHGHVHLGPLLPFEALWGALWRAFLLTRTLEPICGAQDVPPIAPTTPVKRKPGTGWCWMLELAFSARAWLTDALVQEELALPRPVVGFARGKVDPTERKSALFLLWQRSSASATPFEPRGARHRASPRRPFSLHSWARRVGKEQRQAHQGRANRFADDETAFLARCLAKAPSHAWFERVLYQYLRVKVALYRHLVVDPWTIGLKHFIDVEARDKPYIKLIKKVEGEHSLRRARLDPTRIEPPLRVASLEVHVEPTSWLKDEPRLRPLDGPERGWRPGRHKHRPTGPEMTSSWILSPSRSPHDRQFQNHPGYAWKRRAKEIAATCRRVGARLEAQPPALRAVRAVGLMAWERNGPLWLFLSPLKQLMRTSRRIASRHGIQGIAPLRTAFHLGEDFQHLLSGTRRIYEPFEWGLIARRDRVGHALPLGLDVDRWQQRNPWLRMRPWDRLLDIGFIYWAFDHCRVEVRATDLEYYRVQARACLREILGVWNSGGDPLCVARDVWEWLPYAHPEADPTRARRSTEVAAIAPDIVKRVLNVSVVAQRAMAESFSVETAKDLEAMRTIQKFVREHLAGWQVAIEVNPSSNLLVGGLRETFEQPMFHDSQLPITISCDDQMQFATRLGDEYAYAWAGMVAGETVSPNDATNRLEEAASCSMRYGFASSRPRSPRD